MKYLIVDDDAGYLDLVGGMLRDRGHAVDTCTNFDDARRLMESTTYDTLLVDLLMPKESGIKFLKSLNGSTKAYIVSNAFSHPDIMDELSTSCVKCAGFVSKEVLVEGLKMIEADRGR